MSYGKAMSMMSKRILNLLRARLAEPVDREELLGLGVNRLRARISDLRARGWTVLCHEWREPGRRWFRGSAYVLVDKEALEEAAEFVGRSEPGEAEPAAVAHLRVFIATVMSLYGIPYER